MNKLKQFLPFVFPVAAMILVVVLAVRWYRLRNEQTGQISEFAEGVEIENLSQTELNQVLKGTNDVTSVSLEPEADAEAVGELRYELKDGKVRFTVNADLPEITEGVYQVWLREPNGTAMKRAFILELSKGGYMGSAAISEEALPFDVVVSQEKVADDKIEVVLLRGTVEAVNTKE